ncbi:hypothetical protein AAVH_20279 [Aphelenchoides avenae]|nr:hypothetical protein AAVH_20279 [Aphelenchus avenae]
MSDYEDEDTIDVAWDSSDDEEESTRWAYQDAKTALLSEESNAVACFQRVLAMEAKEGLKTVWGFKALKHLVIASIQAKDLVTAAIKYGRLLEYSGVVSSAVMEPAIDEIIALAQDPEAALAICQATYNIRKPTTTWMARCIRLLSDVRRAQCHELLGAALESASTLRDLINDAAHWDDATRQSHLLSIEAITAEFRFRREEFEDAYFIYRQLKEKSESINPGAVAAIDEIFAKVLLSPSSNLSLDEPHSDTLTLAGYCLEEAIKIYPRTDTQAHIRCWRYLTVIQALSGQPYSSKLVIPDASKPDVDAVARIAALYIDDHGELFLAAWEQARAGLVDAFLQDFFDATTMEKYAAVRNTRLLIICAAEIETFSADGKQYSDEVMPEISVDQCRSSRGADAYQLAQKINSRAAAVVCQLFGQNEMRRGRLNFARQQLTRAFTLYAGGDRDRRRECAMLLAFSNYFQVCRVKARIEDDVVAFLSQEECLQLKGLAVALRRADAQGFASLLRTSHLRLGKFMRGLLVRMSADLTKAMRMYGEALELRASGKTDALCTLLKNLHAKCSRGPWFEAPRAQIGAFVAIASEEVGRKLLHIYYACRELENCDDTAVLALSIMHDSWGRECLRCRKLDAAGRHFEKALRSYQWNVTATGGLGALFLALISIFNEKTLAFDQAIARFDRWLTDDARAFLRRFYDAHTSEDIVAVEAAVMELKESDAELADLADHYASVLHTKLQLRQLGTPHAWKLVFDRLTHRGLHHVQLICRSFRSIVRPRLRHASIGPIVVRAQMAPSRHEWAVHRWPRSTAAGRPPIATVELVDRLEETCGSAPIPKLVIQGVAPLDHPQLLEYAARHDVHDLVLESDFSGLAYPPLRRFLQKWKSIGSLTIRTSNAADSVCVSDDLLRDAAECGIEEVSIRCEQAAGITEEGILDFWFSATSRSLEVIRPVVSQDFLRRLLQAPPSAEPDSEADLTIYASANDVLRQLNWDDYSVQRKAAGALGSTYEFAVNGVVLESKISLNEHCMFEEVGSGRQYDVLRVTRRRING